MSQNVFDFFEKISKIPRGSGNEKEISDYIVNFAKKRGLWYNQDSALNVIIKKEGTKGYENLPPVIIQGHIDMVCEKNSDKIHDFKNDSIKIIYDGDFIKADETTLGADDGIAAAMQLALLDSTDIEHPPIEAVFTTGEETGMEGAAKLNAELLSGNVLINIDSEDEGIFTVGCAGGMKTYSRFKIDYEENKDNFNSYSIIIRGLKGGHSGVDIIKKRANANLLMARLIKSIMDKTKIYINYISGGAKDNAIPREAEAVISFDKMDYDLIYQTIKECETDFKSEYANTDSKIEIVITDSEKKNSAFSEKFAENIITAMLLFPNGVQTMSSDIEGLVESSNNVGVIKCRDDYIDIICALRSSVISRKYFICQKIKTLTETLGGKFESCGDYPAWEYNKDSKIRALFVDVYKKMFGKDAKLEVIHAGLECGIFAKKIAGVDIISFGPDIFDAHTPYERVSISSVKKMWDMLKIILKGMVNL